jgi:hypothetical protein
MADTLSYANLNAPEPTNNSSTHTWLALLKGSCRGTIKGGWLETVV